MDNIDRANITNEELEILIKDEQAKRAAWENTPERLKIDAMYELTDEEIDARGELACNRGLRESGMYHKVTEGYNFWTVKNIGRFIHERAAVYSWRLKYKATSFWHMQTTVRSRKN